ncbi:MAG: hypothetical protein ABUR63_04005 [Verrucomicrobiota bacterium]
MTRTNGLALAAVAAACAGASGRETANRSAMHPDDGALTAAQTAPRRGVRGGSTGRGGAPTIGGTGGGGAAEGSLAGTSGPARWMGGSATSRVAGLFERPEPWTKDVSGLAKDTRSDAIISALKSLGGWGNGNRLQIDFSLPLFVADATTPRWTVTGPAGGGYCFGGPDCDPVPLRMPLPTNGNMEGSATYTCDVASGDCHVLVAERNQKKLYELYDATQTSTGVAAQVAIVWDLTKSYPPGMRGEQCTSADAAGLPIAGLLPTADEVAAGQVNHALRFILPNARMKAGVYVHPAGHAGGPSSGNPDAPPYGVRFRLKASFDETPYNAGQRVILHALKRYGMLLADGGNIALTFADDRTTAAKWSTLGITARSFNLIGVDNFEVVDLTPDIRSTQDCVRNP